MTEAEVRIRSYTYQQEVLRVGTRITVSMDLILEGPRDQQEAFVQALHGLYAEGCSSRVAVERK